MTRRWFLQAVAGALPVCTAAELPPQMSITFEEWESFERVLLAESVRTPALENACHRASAILRAAVREKGPQVNKR